MAPIPRCELRLPPDSRRSPSPAAPAATDDQPSTTAPTKRPPTRGPLSKRPFATDAPTKRPPAPVTPSDVDEAPIPTQRSKTRDSAQILEGAPGFSTDVTRDMVEVREHKLHEAGAAAVEPLPTDEPPLTEEAAPDACALLAQCRAEADAAAAAAASGSAEESTVAAGSPAKDTATCAVLPQCRAEAQKAAAGVAAQKGAAGVEAQKGAVSSPTKDTATCAVLPRCRSDAPKGASETPHTTVDVMATPGDVCAHFCQERPESPSSGYDVRAVTAADKRRPKPAKRCKGEHAPVEAYAGLWGGQRAWRARKQLEQEMRTKRKLYEGLHERNRRRREKERRHCVEMNRMMRCRDQALIAEAVDNIAVNKAFYLRFNYNKRLPFMPSAMTEHLRRFKKPPFKFFPKGFRPCRKEVDEFAKLRVAQAAKVGVGLTTVAPTVKIKA